MRQAALAASPVRRRRAGARRSRLVHSARVAASVAILAAVLYAVFAVAFDLIDAHRLVAEVDANLREHLAPVVLHHAPAHGGDRDVDQAPVVVWVVSPDGKARSVSEDAPALDVAPGTTFTQPRDMEIAGHDFRVLGERYAGNWLLVGQSLAETNRVEGVVDLAEVIAGPVIVVAIFFVALGIGLMASSPVEQARQRQLDFTADASHELRTPLTVIEAEVGLALSTERNGAAYREALERIATESKRLRRIVEDLLYLARSDATPPAADEEPVDLNVLARSCADRFDAIARSEGIELSVQVADAAALVSARAEPLDRLCGVLVDNACRYTGRGGRVRVAVGARSGVVTLTVQDSGPGLPADLSLFDRFSRGTSEGEGSGLGLAIADAAVKMTGGRWKTGTSPWGGAQLEVSWRRYGPPSRRSRSLAPMAADGLDDPSGIAGAGRSLNGADSVNGASRRRRARDLPAP